MNTALKREVLTLFSKWLIENAFSINERLIIEQRTKNLNTSKVKSIFI